ncbi:MAG TPA: hypothetical protein VIL49_10300 [Capillimicrobium sp.]|jgi:hypothetical protein
MSASPLRSRVTRAFARHYVEMCVVMLLGMGLLAVPARWASTTLLPAVDVDDPTAMLARMAVIMTVPMVLWMRWRGHGWAPCREMAGAMLAPGLAAIALYETGLVTAVWLLMTIEHAAMFVGMFAVMIARPEEYSGGCHAPAARPAGPTVAGVPGD